MVISYAQQEELEVAQTEQESFANSVSSEEPGNSTTEDGGTDGENGVAPESNPTAVDSNKQMDLPVAQHQPRTPHFDAHRFEKISNIVKQFKLSCSKAQAQFQGMVVSNSRFTAFLDACTANTYVLVIVSDPTVTQAATQLNIENARNHFERFIPRI